MLSIQLLGDPSILRDGEPVRVPRRKSRALVYYLAMHAAPQPRERLLAFFWPDHERQAAQQILRTTLHSLRVELGSAIVAVDDAIGLATEILVDARVFEDELTAVSGELRLLQQSLARYRGDFVAGFALGDDSRFDEWAAVERERLRNLAARGWATLAQRQEEAQQYQAALRSIEQALSFDQLQEDAQRSAIRLHYFGGDRAGAIRRYEHLRGLLDEELGVPPMPETRNLYHAIVTDTLPAPPPLAGRIAPVPEARRMPVALPFVGRVIELRALREAIAQRRFALVEGEPGIGKTRLVLETLAGEQALTLMGAARELERSLPYQPMIEALRDLLARPEWPAVRERLTIQPLWLQELARLLPELTLATTALQPATGPADESRLWEAFNQFLQAIARVQPVIVFLDDLHWSDASTLALLGYLARQETPVAPRFVAAVRDLDPRTPLAELVQALTRAGLVARLPLGRLERADAMALARHLSPRDPAALADWLVEATEGNPYILTEVVRFARETGLLTATGELDHARLSLSPLVPQTVYGLLQSRITPLSSGARRLLDTAVAAGREWEWEVIARAAGLELADQRLFDILDELRAAHLIHPLDATRYAFDHTLIMEVAYRELGEPRHRLMHRHIAEAIEHVYRERLDGVAGLLASHFAEGNLPEQAGRYALRAARLAAGLAGWAEAIAFYQQALPAISRVERGPVLMELGEAHFLAGAVPAAAEAFRAAVAAFEAAPEPDYAWADAARLALARTFLVRGQTAEVVALAREVRAAGRLASAGFAEFMWGTALGHEGADLQAALGHLEVAAELFRRGHEPADRIMLAGVSLELGNVAAQQGDLRAAVSRYRATLEIAEPATDGPGLTWHILGHNNLAYHLHLLDEPDAVEHAREALRLALEKGILGMQSYVYSTLGEIAMAAGDDEAAESYFEAGLGLAERLASAERRAGITANLGRLDARRGLQTRAIERLLAARAEADQLGSHHLAAQVRLWLAPLLPTEEARENLLEARAIAERGNRRLLLDEIARLEQMTLLNRQDAKDAKKDE